uniref:4-(2'-carboxyphenyl)-4-oxybutyric acid synthase n=1 Tax=Cyanidium sp. THAL103 TaxID=3027999 RepID=A0A9Y1MXU6_9RHOD|nr:4-(2'-carboxyphenyl)-4-oxybutyric acid synthase [Cyanidium sp. THAL103]
MYFSNFQCYKYSFNLKSPLYMRQIIELKSREVLICKFLSTSLDMIIWSEICPLPLFSWDSLKLSYIKLMSIKSYFLRVNWTWFNLLSDKAILDKICDIDKYQSLRMCLDTSIYQLLSYIPRFLSRVPISALIYDYKFANLHYNYYESLKIKLSYISIKDSVNLVRKYHEKYSNISIRLDMNRNWNLEKFLIFISCFSSYFFEFIEEPLHQNLDLFLLSASNISFNLSIDESLHLILLNNKLLLSENIKTLTLKPSIIGSLNLLLDFINLGFVYKKQIVISSIFESDVGITNLMIIIYYTDLINVMGLDTYQWIHNDCLLLDNYLYEYRGSLYLCFLEIIKLIKFQTKLIQI